MNARSKAQILADELLSLESTLKSLGLWSSTRPEETALQSTVPFCYDTMALDQWLQWVLIPKFRTMIENGSPLPDSCDITNYAELYYDTQAKNVDSTKLLNAIRSLDNCVSQKLH